MPILKVGQSVYVPSLGDTGEVHRYDHDEAVYTVKFTEYTDTSPYDTCYNTVETYKRFGREQLQPIYSVNQWVRLAGDCGYDGMRATVKERRWNDGRYDYLVLIPEYEFETHWSDYLPHDVSLWVRDHQLHS